MRLTRGFGLIDALIALAILSFGLLAMARFQVRMISQTTEVQSRTTAQQFSDELLSTALVDAGNATCYTVPSTGACSNPTALAHAADWTSRATAAFADTPTVGSVLGADGRLTVTLTWIGKESQETRTYVAITDVRL